MHYCPPRPAMAATEADEGAAPAAVSIIANPLAGKKLHKKLYKVVKKGERGSARWPLARRGGAGDRHRRRL